MKLICKITDEDIGEKIIDMENPRLRLGARGIVIRDDGKIAIFNKSNKNEYKLPGGGLEGEEKPEEAFKREVLEETGCKVKLTGVLPISTAILKEEETAIIVKFTADIIDENIKFDTKEIIDVKWLDIEKVRNMTNRELRGYDTAIQDIKDFEDKKIYPLDVFHDKKYKL